MKKIFLCLVLSILPISVFACTAPMGGEEFDKLIQVEKIAKNTFHIKVAKNAKGLHFGVDISVVYHKNGKIYQTDNYIKTLKIKESNEYYTSTFELKKIEGYIPMVEVFWQPEQCCLCGAYGHSDELVLE
ncbi:MAG: hypothetical protein KGV56_06020 [Gammaproteobacteria bacterium]|nr:hypothetical protein [Gammaproteobacteria bacterium]